MPPRRSSFRLLSMIRFWRSWRSSRGLLPEVLPLARRLRLISRRLLHGFQVDQLNYQPNVQGILDDQMFSDEESDIEDISDSSVSNDQHEVGNVVSM